jgi:hypothetical protein
MPQPGLLQAYTFTQPERCAASHAAALAGAPNRMTWRWA